MGVEGAAGRPPSTSIAGLGEADAVGVPMAFIGPIAAAAAMAIAGLRFGLRLVLMLNPAALVIPGMLGPRLPCLLIAGFGIPVMPWTPMSPPGRWFD